MRGSFACHCSDVVEAEGRMFPVTDFYLPGKDDDDLAAAGGAGDGVADGYGSAGGCVGVFAGGAGDSGCGGFVGGRHYKNTEVLPLFARLGMGDQQRVFQAGEQAENRAGDECGGDVADDSEDCLCDR